MVTEKKNKKTHIGGDLWARRYVAGRTQEGRHHGEIVKG